MESRDFLSHKDKGTVAFLHTLETMYSQQSFIEAKRNLRINAQNDRFVTNFNCCCYDHHHHHHHHCYYYYCYYCYYYYLFHLSFIGNGLVIYRYLHICWDSPFQAKCEDSCHAPSQVHLWPLNCLLEDVLEIVLSY